MIKEKLNSKLNNDIKGSNINEIYDAVLKMTQEQIAEIKHVEGERKLYYISAEFLIGKLLTNNLMNLGIYDEVESILKEAGIKISDLEDYEAEPSLGNGGLGRLAACFLDSIATLGINGEGLGLNYHYGLFKQVFENNKQFETKDVWMNKPSWMRKTDFVTDVEIAGQNLQSRMYEIDIVGYNDKKTSLRLFDLESTDENLVNDTITFDQSAIDKNLTLFLYPDDSTEEGLRLRFAQQYFMVASSLAYVLDQYKKPLNEIHKHIVIQINDTHPSLAILLMFKHLLNNKIKFNEAVEIVSNLFAYTNHTILAEALEKWPLSYFETVDKDLLPILEKLDKLVKSRSKNEKVALIDKFDVVHMASLAIHFSFSVNGVAALHTQILTESELNDFYKLYPNKFNNKTNGITFRRWLQFSNRKLSDYIESLIGDSFKADAMQLEKLIDFIDDEDVLEELLAIKADKKHDLNVFIKDHQNIDILENGIYDIQIKRLHEYKRQQMNLLYIIHKYKEIKAGILPKRPLVFFFGSKAAPAYTIAKDIIHTLLTLEEIIEKDLVVSKHLQIVFVENYNVTKAEYLIPACDVSEQISLASKEASGTGNMKLMLNGALTLGTMDGANVEIAQLVGEKNIYIFGKDSDTIIEHYKNATYIAKDYYKIPVIKEAVDFITSDIMLKYGDKTNLERLHHELVSKDWFMTLIDFEDYIKVKDQMFTDYEDRLGWAKMMLVNISKAGFFSSDRTIADYNKEIWKV